MSAIQRISALLLLVGMLSTALPAHALPTASANADQWRFKVTIDDRAVGFHSFDVTTTDGSEHIKSQAEFNVKILFVNVFRYLHENNERWESNCLTQIDASTKINGKSMMVQGFQDEQAFVVTNNQSTQQLEGCIRTFAYWNPDFLSATQLLNSQTGEVENVNVSFLGQEPVPLGEQSVQADRYRITMEKGAIDLWYDVDSKRWLGLESETPQGQLIRYIPIKVPTA